MDFHGIGTAVNAAAIVVGALIGVILKAGLPERVEKTVVQAVGLSVVVIGLQMAFKTQNILICVVSLAIGAVLGELMDIDAQFNRFGQWAGMKIAHGDAAVGAKIAMGFITASLLFCPGAMGVVGSIQDGLIGDANTLYAKALLDGIFSVVMAANLGIGVALSAVSVGVYQGAITLCAGLLEPVATPAVLAEITSVGGVMVFGIGLNLLELTKIKIPNMVPALIPAVILAYYL